MTEERRPEAGVEGDAPADEPHRPRPHDHLVEPLYGGLEVRSDDREPEEEDAPARGLLARLKAALGLRG